LTINWIYRDWRKIIILVDILFISINADIWYWVDVLLLQKMDQCQCAYKIVRHWTM
jgi:hypothetical protein